MSKHSQKCHDSNRFGDGFDCIGKPRCDADIDPGLVPPARVTTIVNLWAGPGAGKSTTAAQVFAALKLAGVSAELITEYVKQWAWRGQKVEEWDDIYIHAKQLRREAAVYGKVEYIVTDSPVGLNAVYERMYKPGCRHIEVLCASTRHRQLSAGLKIIDCILKRLKPYVAEGRYEDAAAARRVDTIVAELVTATSHNYVWVDSAGDVLRAIGRGDLAGCV